jgi:hypothetical protein
VQQAYHEGLVQQWGNPREHRPAQSLLRMFESLIDILENDWRILHAHEQRRLASTETLRLQQLEYKDMQHQMNVIDSEMEELKGSFSDFYTAMQKWDKYLRNMTIKEAGKFQNVTSASAQFSRSIQHYVMNLPPPARVAAVERFFTELVKEERDVGELSTLVWSLIPVAYYCSQLAPGGRSKWKIPYTKPRRPTQEFSRSASSA